MTVSQELAALRATVEAHLAASRDEREQAARQRAAIANDVEEIKAAAMKMEAKLAATTEIAREAKAVTDQVKGWKAIATGIAITFGMIGAAFLIFKDHVASFIKHVILGS